MNNDLILLSCSDKKSQHSQNSALPAIETYDGPMYQSLRKFLREYRWPANLSISALSAQHGLFGAIKGIEHYDLRMTPEIAQAQVAQCRDALSKWRGDGHANIHVALGKDYLPAVEPGLAAYGDKVGRFEGGIGAKRRQLNDLLRSFSAEPRTPRFIEPAPAANRPPLYFLPDWDDLLDPHFNFNGDNYSANTRSERGDLHCHHLIQPTPMCDGILVSLAQRQSSKGPLRKLDGLEPDSLKPKNLREHYGLSESQFLFGDCGAFSYVTEDEPAITTAQAIALYELYDFDFGTSVDHIPHRALSDEERQARVELTISNAADFIKMWRKRGQLFTPVAALQGITADQYAANVRQYYDMGYRHMAIGGLVPLSDSDALEIVEAVSAASDKMLPKRPWIHIFGIYRPRMQRDFRALNISSFDSASYFRKAWLQSDKNYLTQSGEWYSAIRVPMTKDGRTRKRLLENGADLDLMAEQERIALQALIDYGNGNIGLDATLDAVLNYDKWLLRRSDSGSMRAKYRRTLENKPWQNCACSFCKKLGIQMLIFRGSNRNRRRGAHNTAMMYRQIRQNHKSGNSG